MTIRKMIVIDREKCIGCRQCVDACPGGALDMVDGKAELVRDDFCDGMGVCIGTCPADAIRFVDRPVEEPAPCPTAPAAHGGCPGSMLRNLKPRDSTASQAKARSAETYESELGAWPIQLHLIQPTAPQFAGKDVLIAASCTAFSCGGFHPKLLAGKGLIIACPKLDRQDGYAEKLRMLFTHAKPASVTIARMDVPCCMGLTRMVQEAKVAANSDIPVEEVVITLDGRRS